jgi:hypothetical protein
MEPTAEYTAFQRLLLRRALGPAATSAGLLQKAQAIDILARDGVPVPVEEIRIELSRIIAASDTVGTDRAARAASISARLLDMIDGEAPDEPPDGPLPNWDNEELSLADRQFWLEISFAFELACALGWRIGPREWNNSPARVRWLMEQTEPVLAAADPFAEADRVLAAAGEGKLRPGR